MPKTKKQPAPDEPTLEAAIDRLGEIVDRIEGESLELDEALALFEEGVGLLRGARARLDAAEERVQRLVGEGDDVRLEPMEEL